MVQQWMVLDGWQQWLSRMESKKGRNGKGNIFILASGNGGKRDCCGADGYTTSMYTISIAAVTEKGNVPWYVERCASSLASSYSSGSSAQRERRIVTTEIKDRCTKSFTG